MNSKIEKLLKNQGENYILPFFWQHGEDEKVLREYMKVIDESNVKAVCVESRPHPDYCGPKWWEDMDVILDEARKRGMKVWILDDSHFPTGFANGAMSQQPDEKCRQSLCCRIYDCTGGDELHLEKKELFHPDEFKPSQIELHIGEKNPRVFQDDRLMELFAVPRDKDGDLRFDERIALKEQIRGDELRWTIPEGQWRVYALHLSRNMGYHRNYINMMDKDSCKVLLDAVYEPHYAKYKEDFGKTIAGFFSDEPELGNGHLYAQGNVFGTDTDYPWSMELEECLKKSLGEDFAAKLALLWEEGVSSEEKAKVRYAYMDAVTSLVQQDFSIQIGEWCRAHGVKYIGHLIEDNNQHGRTGSSLGHFYRGLGGQDMAGIDDIGGQVLPQGEDLDYNNGPFATRLGEFYHYMLGKLGSSAAAIEPLKNGDSMCEIFGAYGWSAGVRLEKYLVDHFLVRGINHFVPHAFSPKEFPDPDCPPHFYAHGNNPQYRHFGSLMAYTNRVCELISGGKHIAPAAVLYHGEGEWTGKCMFSHRVGHVLSDAQIEYDYIPQDVFAYPERFGTVLEKGLLKVNTQEYRAVIVPMMEYVTRAFGEYVCKMLLAGIPVLFVDARPIGICDETESSITAGLIDEMKRCKILKVEEIAAFLLEKNFEDIHVDPVNGRIRYFHYVHRDGSAVYVFVNEGTQRYEGKITLKENSNCYIYDAWNNCLREADYDGTALKVAIEPLNSLIAVFDSTMTKLAEVQEYFVPAVRASGKETPFGGEWRRSLCRSIEYPNFKEEKAVSLPDHLTEENPEFSGFVRYENRFEAGGSENLLLEITDAFEGVEVFVNGKSHGIQIVPPFLYDISGSVKPGENGIAIEVATTLEREMAKVPNMFGQKTEPSSLSGIVGTVTLYRLDKSKSKR